MNWKLDFIKQEDYKEHVRAFFREVVECSTANNIIEFNKNIIDPIKMTFSYFATGEDKTGIINSEVTRQQDKTINNSIGYFHQNIFQYIEGWEVPRAGFDIINQEKHIFVELKNKHNTMNSASSQKTYINMQSKILDDDEAICLLVEVIAKKSQDIPWAIKVNGENKKHKNIRRVSLDKFYELVTGDPNAFKKIVEWLPITLKDLVVEEHIVQSDNLIIEQLEEDGSFFEGLYKLAFRDYLGFNDLAFVGIEKLGEEFSK